MTDERRNFSVYMVDLITLFAGRKSRAALEGQCKKRLREIYSICMFTLCIENDNGKRYVIGFPVRGRVNEVVPFECFFRDDFGQLPGVDFVMIEVPKAGKIALLNDHRIELKSFQRQPSTNEEAWAKALTERFVVAPDDDLRLAIHIEQAGVINEDFIHALLKHGGLACPFSQVFVFGLVSESPEKWRCIQVYPDHKILPELDEDAGNRLLMDREQYSWRKTS